jgi:hypothetical protein
MKKGVGMTNFYTRYLSAVGALLALSACNDPKTFVPTNTEKFVFYERDYYTQAKAVLQADYMIVTDLSWSMGSSKSELLAALNQFAQHLTDEEIDYRVGFVRGTNQSKVSSQSLAFYESTIPSVFLGSLLTPTAGASLFDRAAEQLAGLAKPNAPNEVYILEAAKRTMAARSSQFVRSAAQLVYVFISDNDDRGEQTFGRDRSHYFNALKKYKSSADYINARAFVYGGSGCPVPQPLYGDKAGTRLAEVASDLNSSGPSRRCLSSYASMAASLEDLAVNITKPTKRFALRAKPVPGSVTVRVNGSYVPQSGGPHNWSYSSTRNEIVFSNPIDPQANLAIEYDMLMTLARQPRVDTMVVTINGSDVPKSNWSFNASTRELRLTGAYSPNHSDNILVNYEVQ